MSERKGTLFNHEDFTEEVLQSTKIDELRKRIEVVEGDIVGLRSGMHHNYEKINALEDKKEELKRTPLLSKEKRLPLDLLAQFLLYKLTISLYKLIPALLLIIVLSFAVGYYSGYHYLLSLIQP